MATLQRLGDEAQCPLNLSQMRIGRASDNEIIVEDDSVSGHHARIIKQQAEHDEHVVQYVLEDLDSTNKTYVNNNEISTHQLKDGDIVRVGRTRLKFSTKEYVPPQTDFQKTQKLTKSSILGHIFRK